MPKRWLIREHDPAQIVRLEREAGVSAVVAQLLIGRGICDPHVVGGFLDPKLTALRDPEELPGIPAAADRLLSAIAANKPIVVYGDYDADGMTATAILLGCLQLLGANASFYVPNRIDEGYGLNHEALRSLAERGATVVVTVDCGITSIDQALTARELGLELIITDHHEMAAELPTAAAIVHPRLSGHGYPFAGLSGAGVAFKLAWALCRRKCQAKRVTDALRSFLLQAVGIAAIGTVADIVPLIDENRILVYHGLTSLKHQPTPGVAALMRLTKLDQKPALNCEDIGFTLAPRLNAAGRLGQAQLGVELLTTTNAERAGALAEYLHELNNSRDSLERSIYLAAKKQLQEQFDAEQDAALVLASRGWHPGVIGIVAGRLAEKHHRPVVLIAQDDLGVKPGIGSVRGVPGFQVHLALTACTQWLLSHGGHAAAGGLKIEDGHVGAFRMGFCEFAAQQICDDQRVAELWIDGETALATLTLKAVEQIERLAPFGHGNHRPLLCASHLRLAEPPKRIGASGRHLSLRLEQHGARLRGVAFGGGEWFDELAGHAGLLNVAFRPVINTFNGRRAVELHVVDWRAAESAVVAKTG
ncbi:MAG TPA: single-stranded-DNA-specific exonuclease RecJ [Pirellulales bacterium]|jgi:single-stranded-DNA-specific exonuclease|nr:single-stranded-DNA-specific exonuclease RecJ [Pirellulales bacterium]